MMRARFLALLGLLGMAGCGQPAGTPHWPSFGGDPDQGRIWVTRASCGACHVIPGIENAHGEVGPPLAHYAQRTVIAGMLPNTPQNLTYWIAHPQAVVPGNAMPDTGLSDQEARDVAAYLYTLR